MGNKETIKKFLGGLMIGGLLLGGTGFALAANAADTSSTSSSNTTINGPRMPGMKNMNSELMQSVFDSLVSSGTITQAQVDQILAKEKQLETERQKMREQRENMTQAERQANRKENKPEKAKMFTQLVNDGTINQEQADAIRTAMHEKMAAQRQVELNSAVSGLVEKNVINTEQSTAILSKLTEMQTARQAQMEAMREMAPEQRQTYMKANKPQKVNPFDELVAAGTLTQGQADEVSKALGHFKSGKGMLQGRGNCEGGFRGCLKEDIK
jgi:hypothetical protein